MDIREGAGQAVRDIRCKTYKQYLAEEKIQIVLAGLRGEDSISELCRLEDIAMTTSDREIGLGFGIWVMAA